MELKRLLSLHAQKEVTKKWHSYFPKVFSSFVKFIISYFRTLQGQEDQLRSTISALRADIRILEEVQRCQFVEINDMQSMQQQIKDSQTLKGKFYNICGYFFAFYCLYKITMAAVNIMFQRVRKIDPISKTIQIILTTFLGVKLDVRLWSQYASFVLVGILVFTQMRGFLLQVMKLFHAWSSVVTASTIILFSAEIMGMYFVSSVLLMRMNLPLEYRKIITKVLGDIEFHFYHHWFDVIFLIAAVGSILILIISRRQTNPPIKHAEC